MRARRTIRVPTAAQAIIGASVLVFPATAVAAISDNPLAGTGPAGALRDVHTTVTGYGDRTLVRGSAPSADAGTGLELDYRPTGAAHWRTVAEGVVRRDGNFVLTARIGRSGSLQVEPRPSSSSTGGSSAAATGRTADRSALTPPGVTLTPAATPTSQLGTRSTLAPSPVSHIWVRPQLKLASTSASAIAGQATVVRGHLLPGVAGRRLLLEVRQGRGWQPVAVGRTRAGGAFSVRFTPTGGAGAVQTRIVFRGDRVNTKANSDWETISEMQYAEVSWYDDAGDTACGFHAAYGIASRTLPCGTKVTLSYGGRTVTATVDDRGPFVYSRLYDLDQATAGALGMDGVAQVLAST